MIFGKYGKRDSNLTVTVRGRKKTNVPDANTSAIAKAMACIYETMKETYWYAI